MADQTGPFYEVGFGEETIENNNLGILIGKAVSLTQANGGRIFATVDGVRYTFSSCTSPEAVHLMVQPVAKSKSQLVWHDYYYLGYDVEPTCTDDDYADMNRLSKSFNRVKAHPPSDSSTQRSHRAQE